MVLMMMMRWRREVERESSLFSQRYTLGGAFAGSRNPGTYLRATARSIISLHADGGVLASIFVEAGLLLAWRSVLEGALANENLLKQSHPATTLYCHCLLPEQVAMCARWKAQSPAG
jgi:hypothetical protein